MTLLAEVIESHGGAELWRQLRRFCARVSINGALLAGKSKAGALKDVVIDGSTRDQFLRFTGFTAPDRRATFRPDRVTVESLDGQVLAARNEPRAAFAGHTDSTAWDDLHLAYFVGYANWNYFTTPFLLAGEGFVSEELAPCQEDGQTWRRLKVSFPSRIATHSPEQTFYFDQQGLQRCVEYRAVAAGGAMFCDYTWAQEEFSGIIVPTHRSACRIASNGRPVTDPPSVTVELLDVAFE
jgi:hypothetical protein